RWTCQNTGLFFNWAPKRQNFWLKPEQLKDLHSLLVEWKQRVELIYPKPKATTTIPEVPAPKPEEETQAMTNTAPPVVCITVANFPEEAKEIVYAYRKAELTGKE